HRCTPQTETHHHFDIVYICACGASASPDAPRWTNRNTRRRPMTIADEFHHERQRAHQKHRDKPGGSMEMKNWNEADWSDVLMEELGEASRARNDYRHGLLTLDDYRTQLRHELVQLGAMTEAWI